MQEEIDALRQVSILRELTDEELTSLRLLLTVRECQPKQQLLQEGQPVTEFSVSSPGPFTSAASPGNARCSWDASVLAGFSERSISSIPAWRPPAFT